METLSIFPRLLPLTTLWIPSAPKYSISSSPSQLDPWWPLLSFTFHPPLSFTSSRPISWLLRQHSSDLALQLFLLSPVGSCSCSWSFLVRTNQGPDLGDLTHIYGSTTTKYKLLPNLYFKNIYIFPSSNTIFQTAFLMSRWPAPSHEPPKTTPLS